MLRRKVGSGAVALWVGVAVLAGLAAAVWWLLSRGTRGAELANVLALPVAVIGLLVTALGWSWRSLPPTSDDMLTAARRLCRLVGEQEATTQQRLLADTGDPRPADVEFVQPRGLLRWRADGSAGEGSLETVGDFYRGLNRGRLVILGEPGAGKTVLAIQLLLDLARANLPLLSAHHGRRVPIRLSLPTFRRYQPELLPPDQVRVAIDRWIVEELVRAYGQRRVVARQMVEQGWILPILDGLDEMDPDEVEPVQASSVVRSLNIPSGPGLPPVVLVCRSRRYQEIADRSPAPDGAGAARDATAINILPLDVDKVAGWLAHRFPEPAKPDSAARRWQPLLTRMHRHPAGALARSMSSPLRLYLVVTGYADPRTAPRELLTVPAMSLDEHLLGRLLPAITAHHPLPDGTRYDPGDVQRWLVTLAKHLSFMRELGESGVDLYPRNLWLTAGHDGHDDEAHVRLRRRVAILYAAVATLPTLPAAMWYVTRPGNLRPRSIAEWLFLVLLFELPRIAGRRALLGTTLGGYRVDIQTQGHGEPLRPAGIGKRTPGEFPRVSKIATRDARPSSVVYVALGAAAAAGLGWLGDLPVIMWLPLAVAFALTAQATSSWPRYALARLMMRRTGELPSRLEPFLDWAYAAGLLRLSGDAMQFRHQEFQAWIGTTAKP